MHACLIVIIMIVNDVMFFQDDHVFKRPNSPEKINPLKLKEEMTALESDSGYQALVEK